MPARGVQEEEAGHLHLLSQEARNGNPNFAGRILGLRSGQKENSIPIGLPYLSHQKGAHLSFPEPPTQRASGRRWIDVEGFRVRALRGV